MHTHYRVKVVFNLPAAICSPENVIGGWAGQYQHKARHNLFDTKGVTGSNTVMAKYSDNSKYPRTR